MNSESGESEANEAEESRVFRIARGVNLQSRNFENLRAPEGWQDNLISTMFRMAISEDENTAAAIGKGPSLQMNFHDAYKFNK